MKIKASAIKFVLIVGCVIGAAVGFNKAVDSGYFESKPSIASSVPSKIELPTDKVSISEQSVIKQSKTTSTYEAKLLTIPWNATIGVMYANGDEKTSKDSLMAKRGIKLAIERQDDYSKMAAEQVKFAKEFASGNKSPTSGAPFVIIMGDGAPSYLKGLNTALHEFGHTASIKGAAGYSRGEDKCIMSAEVKTNPQKARGSLVAAVITDGDWNICVKYASDNGIPINPDEKTYNPNAMNFAAVDSFTDADTKLINKACENRDVVDDSGKKTGAKKNVCVNGTGTWTPGDANVFEKTSGKITVASTKDYIWQMPATIIVDDQWAEENKDYVANFLAAIFEANQLIKINDEALTKGAEISAKVYKEKTADFWKTMYKGSTVKDLAGVSHEVGGSTVMTLADNLHLFGLNGNDNLYKRVYTVFGNIAKTYYPDRLPELIAYEKAVDTQYIEMVAKLSTSIGKADVPSFTKGDTGEQFAKKSYSITFASGSSEFKGDATKTLNELLNQLSIGNKYIEISGHTDNVGNPDDNLTLSKGRANKVKHFLMTNADSMTDERIKSIGFGDTQSLPGVSNKTEDGRKQNRRVEIILFDKK